MWGLAELIKVIESMATDGQNETPLGLMDFTKNDSVRLVYGHVEKLEFVGPAERAAWKKEYDKSNGQFGAMLPFVKIKFRQKPVRYFAERYSEIAGYDPEKFAKFDVVDGRKNYEFNTPYELLDVPEEDDGSIFYRDDYNVGSKSENTTFCSDKQDFLKRIRESAKTVTPLLGRFLERVEKY